MSSIHKDASSTNNTNSKYTVEASHVLRLIQAHLTECGLHESCRLLREESGVNAAGVLSHVNFKTWASTGQWGTILDALSTMERTHVNEHLLADIHEMAILELADADELELAYATLRLVQDDLDRASKVSSSSSGLQQPSSLEESIPRSRVLEQRLAALVALRAASGTSTRTTTPPDFYGTDGKQKRRDAIGKRLAESIPIVPPSRLTALLQQAIKWQSHTGQLPMIRQHWDEGEEDQEEDQDDKKKKRKRKKRKKEFDLVLGQVNVRSTIVGETAAMEEKDTSSHPSEPIPSKPYSTIKFGKRATAECALFLPDASGLVTGSSDGFVEIWDPSQKYSKLRMDLPYQANEDLLGHVDDDDDETPILALAVSNDATLLATGDAKGKIKIWRIDTGKCLRDYKGHERSVSCLSFSQDGSHVLSGSHDATCREFGLRTSRMLKEFRGHASYVNTCHYVLCDNNKLLVVTSSADGTVRVWDGKTSEVECVLRPFGNVVVGASVVVDHHGQDDATTITTSGGTGGGSTNIHSVLPLHTPRNTMIVVPRGPRAFLLTYGGAVLRTYETNEGATTKSDKDFVAATVSPSNQWLYAVTEDGICCVFDVATGKMEQSLRNFAIESTSSTSSSRAEEKTSAEISGLVHHPHKGILAAFSNDKGQRRGVLTLWK